MAEPTTALCGCPYRPPPVAAIAGSTVNPHQIVRIIARFPGSAGARCPCCMDPFTYVCTTLVEHTTFGVLTWDSVCSLCADDPHWKGRDIARVLKRGDQDRHVEQFE